MESILFLYASETGTAQDIAYSLYYQFKRFGYVSSILSIDEYDIKNLSEEKFVFFIVSTTGDGDPPVSMRVFWNFLLRRQLTNDCLSLLRFSVFGCGDSGYEKFNAVARKLFTRRNNY
jgi:sulfite reductase alpha subunit-like flavoprotein